MKFTRAAALWLEPTWTLIRAENVAWIIIIPKTTSEKIVPLGLITATIVCLVTGALMITASIFGVPQSFVMIKVASLFAISGLKNGHRLTFANPVTKKTYFSWIITPIIAIIISYLLVGAKDALFN